VDSGLRQNDKKKMKYRAVIFDLFGTLVDNFSLQEYESVLNEMISILKAPHDEFIALWYQAAQSRSVGGSPTLEDNLAYISRELNVSFTPGQIQRACNVRVDAVKLMDFVARALAPKPDALETLARLKSDGYKIALVSNCDTEIPVIWPRTPFAPYFDAAIFSSACGLEKPDPRIYRLATEKLGVKAEACLYIGDGNDNELTGAARAGMHPVLIRHPDEGNLKLLDTGEYEGESWNGRVISSLKEVLGLLYNPSTSLSKNKQEH
jgi:putative hydrolase of the HAD superfamily